MLLPETQAAAVRICRERVSDATTLLEHLEARPCERCSVVGTIPVRCQVCLALLARHRTDIAAATHQLELLEFGR